MRLLWLYEPSSARAFPMKSTQSTLTSLVVLQIAVTVLLAIMAVLTYQGQAEIRGLRKDLAAIQSEWDAPPSDTSIDERLKALEARIGMRDADADLTANALQAELDRTQALDQRMAQLQPKPNPPTSVDREASFPPSALPPGAAVAPSSGPAGLSPQEEAIAKLPAVAKIVTYEKDWGFYTINKGELDGLQADQEFGVRQADGYTLLARLKINRLHPQDAVLDLVSGSQQAGVPTPKEGDLLVDISSLK